MTRLVSRVPSRKATVIFKCILLFSLLQFGLTAQPLTWADPQPLNDLWDSDNGFDDIKPSIATNSSGRQICLWQTNRGLLAAGRATPADQWSEPALINSGPAAGLAVLAAGVVHSGGDSWVAQWVIVEPANSNTRLFTTVSQNNGQSWAVPVETFTSGSFIDFDIASDGAGTVMSVYNTHLLRSQDGGTTWAISNVQNLPSAAQIAGVRIAVTANGTWAQAVHNYTIESYNPSTGGRGNVFLKLHISNDSGATWQAAHTVLAVPRTQPFTVPTLSSLLGDLTAAGNQFGMAYKYFRSSGGISLSAYVTGSIDGGTSWSRPVESVPLYTDNTSQCSLSLAGNSSGKWVLASEHRSIIPSQVNFGNNDISVVDFHDITTTGSAATLVIAEPDTGEKHPAVAVSDEGAAYIFYQTDKLTTQIGADWDIALKSRLPEGQQWSASSYVNMSALHDLPVRHDQRIGIKGGDNGTMVAAWKVNLRRAGLIPISRSIDNGKTWTTVTELLVSQDKSTRSYYGPEVYYNGNNGYWLVAWDNDDYNKFYKVISTDDGRTWSPVSALDGPILAHDQRGVMFKRSQFNNPARTNNGGATWQNVFLPLYGDLVHTGGSNWFKVESDRNFIYVSNDNAYTWTRVTCTNYPPYFSKFVSDHQGTVVAVTIDESGPTPVIRASASSDNGITWSPPYSVAEETREWGSVTLEEDIDAVWAGGENWAIVWNSQPVWGVPGAEARANISLSHDGGITWGSPVPVLHDSQVSGIRGQVDPVAAAIGPNLFIAWENAIGTPSTEIPYGFDEDLYYSTTTVPDTESRVSDWSLYGLY